MYAMTAKKANVVSLEDKRTEILHAKMDDISDRFLAFLDKGAEHHDVSWWTAVFACASTLTIELEIMAENGSESAPDMLRDIREQCDKALENLKGQS